MQGLQTHLFYILLYKLWRKNGSKKLSEQHLKPTSPPTLIFFCSDPFEGSDRWMFQFSSVAQLCWTVCDPMNCSTPSIPVHHQCSELAQTQVHWVRDAIQPSYPLSPLPFPPSIFPSIRVFSNKSVLCIRWPKYWSFSFSISPSNEYSGLIFFRMDWLDFLAV